jgi:hypothetical protein
MMKGKKTMSSISQKGLRGRGRRSFKKAAMGLLSYGH